MALDKSKFVIDKVAYNENISDYRFKATFLHEPPGDALIEIFKNDVLVREFLFPSYKVWNIPAHAHDIIEGLDMGNDSGLFVAGNDGLGGNSYDSKS